MSVVNAIPLLLGDEGYQISRSVRLRSSASAYFNRTPGSAGNRRTFTISAWVKRGLLDASERTLFSAGSRDPSFQNMFLLNWSTSGQLRVYGDSITVLTTAVYRDPSAWYHIVVAVDTTQATASNRVKMYVNGVQVTAFSTANYPSQNYDFHWNNTTFHEINRWAYNQSTYGDQYLTEMYNIDGQSLDPSSFGETDVLTGVWKPKKYTGTYGTNGFYLNFSDNSASTATTIGKDYSSNGNNWTPNNISVTSGSTYDSMLDVPTLWADGGNGRGNYATFDAASRARIAPLDGNLRWSGSSSSPGSAPFGLGRGVNFPMFSGKWYWEITPVAGSSQLIGIAAAASVFGVSSEEAGLDGTANSYFYLTGGGAWFGTTFTSGWGSSYTTSDVISVAYDADAGRLYFAKNNVWQASGNPSGGTNGVTIPPQGQGWVPYVSSSTYSGNSYALNAGQRPFAYTPPTGFKALNTQNLPEPTIKKGNQWFDINLWTGTGANRSIVNSGAMRPDLVWIKSRSVAGYYHVLTDSVRGTNSQLFSNDTLAEETRTDRVTSFNSDGFSLGSKNDVNDVITATFVGWQWKEGATPGFDIVTFTSTGTSMTVNHNLGVTPNFVILKRRDSTDNWFVNSSAFSTRVGNYLVLNSTAAIASSATTFTGFSSSTVSFGAGLMVNAATYVMYAFADVAGFSRFGSYTGNGSTDGPFCFTGFRPKFVMIKVINNTYDWEVADSSRSPDNFVDDFLVPNSSAAENANVGAANSIDFLSNGFKIRANWTRLNDASGTFIYMAFAEFPFRTALAR